jgi:hypothetical protein
VRGTKAASRRAGKQQLLVSFARSPCGAQNKIKGLSSSYFFSTELFFTLSPLFSLYLACGSDDVLLKQPQRVGGGLQFFEELSPNGLINNLLFSNYLVTY